MDTSHLGKKDIQMILSALHVAAGYPMGENIEAELGFTRVEKDRLFEKVSKIRSNVPKPTYFPNKEEAQMIAKCLEVCLKYIDAWEFSAVMDHSKEEVQRFYE